MTSFHRVIAGIKPIAHWKESVAKPPFRIKQKQHQEAPQCISTAVARRSLKLTSATTIKTLNTVPTVTPTNCRKRFGERKILVKTPVLNRALWQPSTISTPRTNLQPLPHKEASHPSSGPHHNTQQTIRTQQEMSTH